MAIYKRVEVPFENQKEVRAFEKFLMETGRKRGPYIRRLIIDAMSRDGLDKSVQGQQLAQYMKEAQG